MKPHFRLTTYDTRNTIKGNGQPVLAYQRGATTWNHTYIGRPKDWTRWLYNRGILWVGTKA